MTEHSTRQYYLGLEDIISRQGRWDSEGQESSFHKIMAARRGSGNGGAKPSRLVSVLMLLLAIGAQTPTSQASTASSANCTGSDGCEDSTTSFSSCPKPGFVGDGDCDGENNTPECDYDGGDCCECTCTDGEFECGYTGYDCVDPAGADCSTNTDGGGISSTSKSTSTSSYGSTSPFPDCTGDPQLVGDGDCNEDNNNEDCEWDGGDCCECTCVSEEHTCGVDSPFNCLDPSPACDDTSTTVISSSTSSAATSVEIPTPAPIFVTSPSTSSDSFTDSPVGSTNGSMSSTEDQSIPPGTAPPTPTTTTEWEGVTHSPSSYNNSSNFVGGSSNSAPGSSRGRAGTVIGGGAAAVMVMMASSWTF